MKASVKTRLANVIGSLVSSTERPCLLAEIKMYEIKLISHL